jgi:membrane protein
LAYYTTFSIAPLLVIAIAVAGLVFGVDAARGEIVGQLRQLMGEEGAKAVEALLASVRFSGENLAATLISGALLLVGATGVFCELQDNLDRIWRSPRSLNKGIWGFLRARLLSFGMVLGIAFLLLVSLTASAALAAFAKFWRPYLGAWEIVAHGLDIVASLALVTLLFAMIYKIMPRPRIDWHDVWTGAFMSALFFSIGKVLIGLYLGRSSFSSMFGAAGSLVVMLVWVYYSAQIFLLGAEFTRVYSHTCGSRCDNESASAEGAVVKSAEFRAPLTGPRRNADRATSLAHAPDRMA